MRPSWLPHRGVETAVMSLSSSSSEMILISRVVAPFIASRHISRKDRERDLRPSVPIDPACPRTGSVPVESANVELGSLCALVSAAISLLQASKTCSRVTAIRNVGIAVANADAERQRKVASRLAFCARHRHRRIRTKFVVGDCAKVEAAALLRRESVWWRLDPLFFFLQRRRCKMTAGY